MNVIGHNQSGIATNVASKLDDSFLGVRLYERRQISGVTPDRVSFDCRKDLWLVTLGMQISCHCLTSSQE